MKDMAKAGKNKCHPEFISGSTPIVIIQNKEEMLKQVQHDSRHGFTLIELLVVVLIIGILAAVAVPQYQKAVDKSRTVQSIQLISSLQKAIEVWIMGNPGKENLGFYRRDATEFLDIDLPCQYETGTDWCYVGKNAVYVEVYADGQSAIGIDNYYTSDNYVFIGSVRDINGKWNNQCGYFDTRGETICKGLQYYEAIENWEF